MPKLNFGVAGAIAIACVALFVTAQYLSEARLREENVSLHRRLDEAARVVAENQRLEGVVAQAKAGQVAATEQLRELMQLRAEVLRLRDQNQQLEKRIAEFRQVASTAVNPSSEQDSTVDRDGNETAAAPAILPLAIRLFKVHQLDAFLEKLMRSTQARESDAFQDTFRRYLHMNGVETNVVAAVVLDARTGNGLKRRNQSNKVRA